MINIYLMNYTVEEMISHAGDVIIKSPIEARCTMERNKEWSVTIKFPEKDLLGYKMVNESFIKVDLPHAKDQIFSVVYWKFDKIGKSYTLYGVDIFHMSQKEVLVTDSEFTQVSNWANAITKLNELITQNNPKFSYILKGGQGYDNTVKPDKFHTYMLVPKYDQTKAVDVLYQRMNSGAEIVFHPMNRTLAQRFYITPDAGQDVLYQIWNEKSILCLDISGAQVSSEHVVTQAGDHDGANQRWKIIPSPFVTGYWCVVSKLNENYCLTATENEHPYYSQDGTYITAYLRGLCIDTMATSAGNKADRQAFQFIRSEAVSLAHWEKMNIIELLFGTSDDAMCNRWEECEQAHVTAMYNNLTCYFGGDYAESWAKPTDYYIVSPKLITEQEKTVDMAEVYTGIVPIGNDKRMLPKDYPGTRNGVVVLGNSETVDDLYDVYKFHREKFEEYNEIVFAEDMSNPDLSEYDVYSTMEHLNRALFNRAKKELKKTSVRKPATDLEVKLSYILDNEQMTKNLKLSDRVYFTGNVSDEMEGFYFDKIEYDLIINRVTDVTLSQIKEDI